MKPLIRIFTLIAIVAAIFAFSPARTTQAATYCLVYQHTNNTGKDLILPFTASATAAYHYVSVGAKNLTFDYPTGTFSGSTTVSVYAYSTAYVYDRNTNCGDGGPAFSDGRLNKNDAAETVAIYCAQDGAVVVYSIDGGVGTFAFRATVQEIAKVPSKAATNTAIKSGNGATLYRLTSGELVVFRAEPGTGKQYHFIFSDCPKS